MSTENYLDVTRDFYKDAALTPDVGLCCTTSPVWRLPELSIPEKMLSMNYGCGTTVHPRDLANQPTVLYVGVGGGMELLQFSYFSRRKAAVIGVDPVTEMLEACRDNLIIAEKENAWFKKDYIRLLQGNALHLPVEDNTVDVAAQNCLFNIFKQVDLQNALKEMYRVVKPHGRLVMSDPFCNQGIPETLRHDNRLRAACISGCIPLSEYIEAITSVGFGTVEVRARRPYRVLAPGHYPVKELIVVESVEVCAIKEKAPDDGPCVFTGKSAIYYGSDDFFDDNKGHVLKQNLPVAVCDKTAIALEELRRKDIHITPSTWFYDGGGCC